MPDHTMKRNDTSPPLEAELSYSDGRDLDLTGATVKIVVRKAEGSTLFKRAVNSFTQLNAKTWKVVYQWQAGDTALAGDYYVEIEVTFPDSKVVSFPNNRQSSLLILPDAG